MQQGVLFLLQHGEPAGCQLDVSPPNVRPAGSCCAFVPLGLAEGCWEVWEWGSPQPIPQQGEGQAQQRGDAAGRTGLRQGELCWEAENQRAQKGITAAAASLPWRNSIFNCISAAHVRKKTSLKSEIQPGQSALYRALNWLRERQELARSFCFISIFWGPFFFFFFCNQL